MLESFIKGINQLEAKMRYFELVATIFLIIFVVLLVLSQVLARNLFFFTFEHFDSISRLLAFDAAMLGAIFATRNSKHLNIDNLINFFKSPKKIYIRLIILLWCLFMTGALFLLSVELVLSAYNFNDRYLGTYPLWLIQLILPYVFLSMFVSNLALLINDIAMKMRT